MRIALTISFLVFLTALGVQAQSSVGTALGKEDLNSIVAQLADRVELCVPGKQGSFSKSEASGLLKQFFDSHVVSGYNTKHAGDSKDRDANYAIGQLTTDKATYRVYVYFNEQGGQRLIEELCIEK